MVQICLRCAKRRVSQFLLLVLSLDTSKTKKIIVSNCAFSPRGDWRFITNYWFLLSFILHLRYIILVSKAGGNTQKPHYRVLLKLEKCLQQLEKFLYMGKFQHSHVHLEQNFTPINVVTNSLMPYYSKVIKALHKVLYLFPRNHG